MNSFTDGKPLDQVQAKAASHGTPGGSVHAPLGIVRLHHFAGIADLSDLPGSR